MHKGAKSFSFLQGGGGGGGGGDMVRTPKSKFNPIDLPSPHPQSSPSPPSFHCVPKHISNSTTFYPIIVLPKVKLSQCIKKGQKETPSYVHFGVEGERVPNF